MFAFNSSQLISLISSQLRNVCFIKNCTTELPYFRDVYSINLVILFSITILEIHII